MAQSIFAFDQDVTLLVKELQNQANQGYTVQTMCALNSCVIVVFNNPEPIKQDTGEPPY